MYSPYGAVDRCLTSHMPSGVLFSSRESLGMYTAYTVASQWTLGTFLPTSFVYFSPYSGTMASICGRRSGRETNAQGNSHERRPGVL